MADRFRNDPVLLMVDISVGTDVTEGGEPIGYAIKIQYPTWEVNIRLTFAEAEQIPNVRNASWKDRTSIRLGQSSGVPAWWSYDEDGFFIAIAHDDEVWDIGFSLPKSALDQISREIELASQRGG